MKEGNLQAWELQSPKLALAKGLSQTSFSAYSKNVF